MVIELLYFAATRDLTGRQGERLQLPAQVRSVAALARHLSALYPALAGKLSSVRFAVNEQFADAEHELSDGDVVALIPPTAGG